MKSMLSTGLLLSYNLEDEFENETLKEIYRAFPIEISAEYALKIECRKENKFFMYSEYEIHFIDTEKEADITHMNLDENYSVCRTLMLLPDDVKRNLKAKLDNLLSNLCDEHVEDYDKKLLKSIRTSIFEESVNISSFATFMMNFIAKMKDEIITDLVEYLKMNAKEVEKIYKDVFIEEEEEKENV